MVVRKVYKYLAKLAVRVEGGKLIANASVTFSVPVRVDGKGSVIIGNFSSLGFKLAPKFGSGEILLQAREPGSVITIGEKSAFSNNVSIVARDRIEMGDYCLVGDRVTIMDADFHIVDPDLRLKERGPGETAPILIGSNCWIGTDAFILKGVEIGDGSVIAPKSVVTKSFPDRSFIAGNPAQLIRTFSS